MPSDAVANLLLRVRSETSEAKAGLAGFAGAVKAFGGLKGEAQVTVDTRKAQKELGELQKDLAQFARETKEAEIKVDTKAAKADLTRLEVELAKVNRETVTAEADVQIFKALEKIAVLRAAMSAFAHQGLGIDDNQILKDLASLSTTVGSITKNLSGADEASTGFLSRFRDSLAKARLSLGPFSSSLQTVGRVGIILGPILFGIAGGLTALASSVGAAVLGLGALGITLIGVGGAIAALGIGAIVAFVTGLKAITTYKTALQGLLAATRAQRDAEQALGTAQRNRLAAQKALEAAKSDAQTTIANDLESALARQTAAEYQLDQALAQETNAQNQLNIARAEAVRQLQDLKNAADDAKLSEEAAKIALEKARADAEGLAKNDTSIAAQEKRLAVKQAEEALSQARLGSKRSVEDLNTAEKKGIKNSDGVIAAKQSIATAQHAITDANAELIDSYQNLQEAQAATVNTDTGVIAAREALRSSTHNVATSERDLARATKAVAKAQLAANVAYRAAGPLLTKIGKELRKQVNEFQRALRDSMGPGIQQIFKGAASALKDNLRPLVLSLKDDFTGLGRVMGKSLGQVSEAMNSTGARKFFHEMLQGAQKTVPLMVDVFIQLSRILGHIARATMPFLIDTLKDLAKWLGKAGDSTANIKNLRKSIAPLIDSFRNLAHFLGSIVAAIAAVGGAARGDGDNLITWMDKAVQGFTEWAKSTEGQNKIQDFMEASIPIFQGILKILVKLIKLGINLTTILSPALVVLNGVLTTLLDLLNAITGVFAGMPDIIKLAVGGFILWKGPINLIKTLFGWTKKLVGALRAGSLTKALAALKGLGSGGSNIPTNVPTPGGPSASTEKKGIAKVFDTFKAGIKKGGTAIAAAAGAAATKLAPALLTGLKTAVKAGPISAVLAAGADPVARGIAGWFSGTTEGELMIKEALISRSSDITAMVSNVFRDLPQKLQRKIGKSGHGSDIFQAVLGSTTDAVNAGEAVSAATIRGLIKGQTDSYGILRGASAKLAQIPVDQALKKKTAMNHAGTVLGEALANGIKSAIAGVQNVAKNMAQKIRDLFHGSEPKDPTSPLRGFERAGRELVKAYSRGIKAQPFGAPRDLASRTANAVTRGKDHSGQPSQGHTFNFPMSVQGGGFPDPDSYMAAASRAARGRGITFAP